MHEVFALMRQAFATNLNENTISFIQSETWLVQAAELHPLKRFKIFSLLVKGKPTLVSDYFNSKRIK